MHWKIKANIQNIISFLPSSLSYSVYYQIQRHFGVLRRFNPIGKLNAAIDICKRIQEQGKTPKKKVFFEIGTGRVPFAPLAYWLMGAEKTITIDLNPYLNAEIVIDILQYITENKEEIVNLFGSMLDKKRFDELQAMITGNSSFSLPSFLNLCRVDYIAPGDAADTHLPEQSIDFHTSCTVFEHIPMDVLKQIIKEGNRIIKDDGLFIHRIDYSDHFSHQDKRISAINFLQYSDKEWKKIAGNRYMYMNRLRHDDFISLFKDAGHCILDAPSNKDQHVLEILKNKKLHLNERFTSKTEDILATTGAWIVTRKNI